MVDMFNKKWNVGCMIIKERQDPQSASSKCLKKRRGKCTEVFVDRSRCEELRIVIKIRPIESTNFVRIRMEVEKEVNSRRCTPTFSFNSDITIYYFQLCSYSTTIL
jgi:hypothetical protein